jgi:dipeptidyl aminopeptidase/acylaminoacyl peptidase
MRTVPVAVRLHLACLLVPLLACSAPLHAQTTPAAPATPPAADDALTAAVKAMARIGFASSPHFSPDGSRIAFLSNLSGSPQVWVMSAEGGYPQQVTAFDDPVTAVDWSPRDELLAFAMAPGGGLNAQIYLCAPDGTGVRRITPGGEVNSFFDGFEEDGRLAYGTNERNPAGVDLFLLEPKAPAAQRVASVEGVGDVEDVSRDGRWALVSRLVHRGDDNLYLVDLASGKEALLTPHEGPGTFGGKLAADAGSVYLATNRDRDLIAFAELPIANARPGTATLRASRDDAELDDLVPDRHGDHAALLWNVGGRSELWIYDLHTHAASPAPPLPGEIASGITFAPDGKSLALTLAGAAQPSDIWRFDLASGSYRQLTFSPHAGVELASLVKPELRSFTGEDGLALSGWLYLPPGFHAPGPVVLSFHGGPEGQARPSFSSTFQALLSRGIAVFAPNIRGSSGFGKRFVNLDNGALRFEANKDIKSAADYLVKAGVADAARRGILGGSYGGYVVMIGMTDFADTFAAGADLYGIVNFQTFFAHTQPWMAAISKVEYGDPDKQRDLLERLSPINRLEKIRSPLLVMHGANDTNVPVVEAEQIVKNLEQRGVPVEYVLFPDEGHGWRKTTNSIRSTVTLVDFFERHLVKATRPTR